MTELTTKLGDVSPIRKKIEVSVPVEKVREVLEKEYKKIAKTAKIKGFRKGKIPRAVLEQYFSSEAAKEAMNSLVRESYPEALEKEKADPISAPYVEPGGFDKDKPFTYVATFEIRPVIEVKEFAGLKLEKPEIKVTKEEVEHQLEVVRQQMTQLEPLPVDTKSEKGMVMIVDFKGTVDGKEFEGSEAKDFMVELGAGSLLPKLEAELTGLIKDEEKDFEIEYPTDYFNKDLAGKKGVFHVKVKDIKKKITPELNDDFAKDLGNFKTLKDVKNDIEKRITEAKEYEVKRILSGQTVEKLIEKHPFEVPESMTNGELRAMFEGYVKHLASQGKKVADTGMTPGKFLEQYKKEAERRVQSYLIIDAIAEAEKIEVTDAELEERLGMIAQQAKQTLPKVRQYYESQNLLGGLKVQIRHEKTVDMIIDQAKISITKAKKAEKESKKSKKD